ncbi:TPA: hypothetical protein ACGY8I_003487 [Aeromonas hydrophila]|uniref:hypothetical protein n=1 Tax=Aeromonas hydrophila TaxID=644 RepID=UPI001C03EE28|nr:hypothetical protein [Aeromonas hydrophila]QWL77890.1 hypothetical protein HQ395_03385 [Aeromonas hydrophila]
MKQKNRRTEEQKNRRTEEQKNRRTEEQKNRRTEEQKSIAVALASRQPEYLPPLARTPNAKRPLY